MTRIISVIALVLALAACAIDPPGIGVVATDTFMIAGPDPGIQLHVDMALPCQVAMSLPAFSCQACFDVEANPIGDTAGSSETTVDQADIRALASRKTVVRHGAASL